MHWQEIVGINTLKKEVWVIIELLMKSKTVSKFALSLNCLK